jgi:hypothetical protein
MKGNSDEREEHQATDAESWRSGRDAGRSVDGVVGMHVNRKLQQSVTRGDNLWYLKSLLMIHNGADRVAS